MFLYVRADVCRGLPSDSASPRTPLSLAVAFPLSGRLGDLHPLEYTHAGRTKRAYTPTVGVYRPLLFPSSAGKYDSYAINSILLRGRQDSLLRNSRPFRPLLTDTAPTQNALCSTSFRALYIACPDYGLWIANHFSVLDNPTFLRTSCRQTASAEIVGLCRLALIAVDVHNARHILIAND